MLAGKNAIIYVTGEAVTLTNQMTTTPLGDLNRYAYQIATAGKRILDPNTAVVVKVNGTPGSTGFKINYATGTVTFTTQRGADDVITISGAYLPKTQVATAHEFSFGKSVDIGDITRFGDNFKRKIALSKFAYGTLSQWDITDTFFRDALVSATPKFVAFDSGENLDPQVALVYFEKEEIKATISNPQSAVVSFVSTTDNMS